MINYIERKKYFETDKSHFNQFRDTKTISNRTKISVIHRTTNEYSGDRRALLNISNKTVHGDRNISVQGIVPNYISYFLTNSFCCMKVIMWAALESYLGKCWFIYKVI